jgi:O-antigen ligase
VAVYVSGTRSAWLGLGLALLLLSLSNKLKGMVSLSVLLAASTILPPIFFARATTIVDAVSGNVFDTSLISRLDRWKWGINAILSNPIWGVGYGHWLVHNIFLEIGSTIGIIPAIAFLIFVIQLVMRIARVALNRKAPEARRYGWLFLAFAITWIIQLNVEAVFQTTALAVAFWPSMALGWYLSDMFPKSPDKDNQLSSAGSFYDHSINSNL